MLLDADDDSGLTARDRPMFGRDGVQVFLPYWLVYALISLVFHGLMVLGAIVLPGLFPARTLDQAAIEAQMADARARAADEQRFVFVQPRQEFEAMRPPQTPELSDRDRNAQTLERAPNPENALPFSRGNTPEMVDDPAPRTPPEPAPPAVAPGSPTPGPEATQPGATPEPPSEPAPNTPLPRATTPGPRPSESMGSGGGSGRLGDAVRQAQRYYGAEQLFDNPQGGGGQFGSAIQFDTKGVEFGPWIRRFIAQIKRNWNVPYAAMSLRGHVVVTFNVHKDGRITDVTVVGPSGVDGFNHSSFNAISASNPTQPLPPEYPADQAFFTVTFYYNETPPR